MTGSLSYPYTDFLPARSRKKRKGDGAARTIPPGTKLQNLRAELVQDEWFVQCRQMIDDSLSGLKVSFEAAICLGLGSPSSSQNACVQLAFLLEICDYLSIGREKISIYDPAFTEEDLTLLQGLQLAVLPTNENGLHPVDAPTMVFMPHCDMELYENFLKANWKPDLGAMKLLMIGNQLSEYVVNNPLNRLVTRAPCLVQVVPLLQHYTFPASKTWPTAFNNMAVQFMPSELGATGCFSPASIDKHSETKLQELEEQETKNICIDKNKL